MSHDTRSDEERERSKKEIRKLLEADGRKALRRRRSTGPIKVEWTEFVNGKPVTMEKRLKGTERLQKIVNIEGGIATYEDVKNPAAYDPDQVGVYETPGIGRPEEYYLPHLRKMSPRDNSETKMLTLESFVDDWHDVGYLLEREVPYPKPRRLAWINASMRLMRYHKAGLLDRRRWGHRYQYILTARGHKRLFNLWERLGALNPPAPSEGDDELIQLRRKLAEERSELAKTIRLRRILYWTRNRP